jgi:hypothetical protein
MAVQTYIAFAYGEPVTMETAEGSQAWPNPKTPARSSRDNRITGYRLELFQAVRPARARAFASVASYRVNPVFDGHGSLVLAMAPLS